MDTVLGRKRRRQSDFSPTFDWWEDRHKKLNQAPDPNFADPEGWEAWSSSHDADDVYYVDMVAKLAVYYIQVKGYKLNQIMGDALGEAAPNEGIQARRLALAIEALSEYWIYRGQFRVWLTASLKMTRSVIPSR